MLILYAIFTGIMPKFSFAEDLSNRPVHAAFAYSRHKLEYLPYWEELS
ncbi:hypothetical protein [Bacillus sp. FJAT-42376]|nr:hypothetical protein [Bacillus sp. FJAT-42376]